MDNKQEEMQQLDTSELRKSVTFFILMAIIIFVAFISIDIYYTTPICQDNFFKNLIP